MKRRLLCLLLLLFALSAVIIIVPRALDGTLPTKPGPGSDITETIIPPTETMENIVYPYDMDVRDHGCTDLRYAVIPADRYEQQQF